MATRNLVPRANGEGSIGTSIKKWLSGYFVTLLADSITLNGVNRTTWPLSNQYVLASKIGADMNSTADQAITIPAGRYIPRRIVVDNASISLTTAVGGIYTGAIKTGTIIVPASQAYSALTTSSKYIDLTLTAGMATDILTATTIYLSLTTAQGVAATADFFIIGDRLDQ